MTWRTSLKKSIAEIIDNGQYTNSSPEGGKYVELFEKELTHYLGKPTVAVSSGSMALVMSLIHAGVKAGDDVIIPAYGFIATSAAVRTVQANPICVDVNEDNQCMDVDKIKLTTKTKAVLTVDLYGNICDEPKTDVTWISDSCQALGTIKECRADYTCFSFYPTKRVNTMEGGAIAADCDNCLRDLRTYPTGFNFRMGEINAAMGYHQMVEFRGISREVGLGRPDNWYKHYDYTISKPGQCPIADKLAQVK